MARLGPQTEPVIENGCETPGWMGRGGHGTRTGLSSRDLHRAKEAGSPAGVRSLRSSWSSQDATEAKMSLFPQWVAQCHPRPVAQIQP